MKILNEDTKGKKTISSGAVHCGGRLTASDFDEYLNLSKPEP
jgi:hypothetical protein